MSPPGQPTPSLCVADGATFWPWRTWPEFASWPDRERTLVVLPLAGLADWGLGHALDAEETLLMGILREASLRRPWNLPLLVLPPLRFAFGPDPGSAFAVGPPVVHGLLAEIAASVVASGFRRLLLLNSSPWNEEVCAAASRDLRLRHDIQVFRVNLPGLGLDLHPSRSPDRRRVQTVLTALKGEAPQEPGDAAPVGRGGGPAHTQAPRVPGDETVTPLDGPPVPCDEAASEAGPLLSAAADTLLALMAEMRDRPFPDHGFKVG